MSGENRASGDVRPQSRLCLRAVLPQIVGRSANDPDVVALLEPFLGDWTTEGIELECANKGLCFVTDEIAYRGTPDSPTIEVTGRDLYQRDICGVLGDSAMRQ